jgi:formate-dependent nitrite reductase membrane component NrfD
MVCLEIGMLIFGIIALVRGHFLLTRVKEVRGWPARVIGIFLILPLPLSLSIGMTLVASVVATGEDPDVQKVQSTIRIIEVVIVALCFCLAIAVGLFFYQPVRKTPSKSEDRAIPTDYDERFQARPREPLESPEITGEPSPRSAPPDDRIQG